MSISQEGSTSTKFGLKLGGYQSRKINVTSRSHNIYNTCKHTYMPTTLEHTWKYKITCNTCNTCNTFNICNTMGGPTCSTLQHRPVTLVGAANLPTSEAYPRYLNASAQNTAIELSTPTSAKRPLPRALVVRYYKSDIVMGGEGG